MHIFDNLLSNKQASRWQCIYSTVLWIISKLPALHGPSFCHHWLKMTSYYVFSRTLASITTCYDSMRKRMSPLGTKTKSAFAIDVYFNFIPTYHSYIRSQKCSKSWSTLQESAKVISRHSSKSLLATLPCICKESGKKRLDHTVSPAFFFQYNLRPLKMTGGSNLFYQASSSFLLSTILIEFHQTVAYTVLSKSFTVSFPFNDLITTIYDIGKAIDVCLYIVNATINSIQSSLNTIYLLYGFANNSSFDNIKVYFANQLQSTYSYRIL